jgi:hypothetical protein
MIGPRGQGMFQKLFSTYNVLLFAVFVLAVTITLISTQPKSAFAEPPTTNDNVTIIKQTDPDGSPQVFNFTSSSLGTFSLSDGQNITFTGLNGGSTYTFTEIVPFGWNATVSITCDVPGYDVSGSQLSILLPGATSENVACTFLNHKLPTGNITVAKETIPDGNPELFNFTGNLGDFTLGDGQNITFTMPIGFYGFFETDMPLGWAGSTVECSDSGGIISSREFTTSQIPHAGIQLNASDAVTCTFTNEIVLGNITIIKQTTPDNSTQLFNFTGPLGSFTLGDGQNATFTVVPGNYTVNEIVPAGWTILNRSCNFPNADGSSASLVGLNSMVIRLAPNGVVECTFTNQELGTIIVEKQTVPDGAAGNFTFTGNATGTISDNGQIIVSNLLPGNYSTTESDPAPFILTNIFCNDTNSFWNVTARTATFVLEPGEIVKCTFTDTNVLVVDIDIKPGSDPNAINLKKDKIITVAILGNSTFDVHGIDVSPLSDAPKFGGTTPKSPTRVSYQDVNHDGFTDLVLQYKLAGLGFTTSSTEGCISGKLIDGTVIEGCDSVKIIPK